MKKSALLCIGLFVCMTLMQAKPTSFNGKTIIIDSSDELSLKADIYESDIPNAPLILLYHQAGYSRGEYRPIAPKLNKLGFMCIAIDQRSGKGVQKVINETYQQAVDKNLPTKYPDAYPDIESLLQYAVKTYPERKIIVWGSSYSSALVFVLASKFQDKISGLLAFSPGNYFELEGKKIEDYARDVICPVFITSAKDEEKMWTPIFQVLPATNKSSFIPKADGKHGSKALWPSHEINKEYWEAVKLFLDKLK